MKHVILLAALTLLACQKSAIPSVTGDYDSKDGKYAAGSQYAIASTGYHAPHAGREMLEIGGNLVDAATAMSFAHAVERPQSTGLGGGGFMLIHSADTGNTVSIDFRERAPMGARRNMFVDEHGEVTKDSLEGILSGAVPGMVHGVLEVHARYGQLPRETVLAPAIALAREGFEVYEAMREAIAYKRDTLALDPNAARLFLTPEGEPLPVGHRLKQPELAQTLETIANEGVPGFYEGWVANALLTHQKKMGGLITRGDLQDYSSVFREPIEGTYRGYTVRSMPPPSSGGVHVAQILGMLEGDDLKSLGPFDPKTIHLVASAMQSAFADRAEHLGDPDAYAIPVKGLTAKDYTKQLRARFNEAHARSSHDVSPGQPAPHESVDTNHFTLMDGRGNVVVTTQSINGAFGSGLVVPKAGFFMNNHMDDFSAKPGVPNLWGVVGSEKNAVAPGKRPLSSMSPTLVLDDKGRAVFAVGSPNGSRIITCVTLSILNVLEHEMPLYDAVASVRYHHQWQPDELRVDDQGFIPETTKILQGMGHKVVNKPYRCRVQAIKRSEAGLEAVSDPRGYGLGLAQ